MGYGGPPKEDVGPTQGWAGGPPSAPGPRARGDAAVPEESEPAKAERLPPDRARADAEDVARRSGTARRKIGPADDG